MAKKIHRKVKHGRGPLRRNGFRNAESSGPTGVRRRSSPREEPAAAGASAGRNETPGWKAIKTAGGALGAALACALIARENWLPPSAVTGVVSAIGATLAVGGNKELYRDVGLGVMSAAGSQLALLTIDNHISTTATNATTVAARAGGPAAKHANADSLPPGALENAYRRARERLAMANAVASPSD